ncbi:MAG: proton-conducting transporter membrane subunit [Desulfobacterales bacterium]|jgi:multicomponent Na+:H+ antiporter subunit D|nr:proton-conducting transporter membrane subunit [Desulfobacterales bacterium]
MSALPASVVIVPLLFAALAMGMRLHPRRAHELAVAGAALHLILGVALFVQVAQNGIQVVCMGAWDAPFGISLAVDTLAAVMVVITGIIGLASIVYAGSSIDADLVSNGFYALLHILLTGITGAFLTADLFNLYVWFEVMLMSSFGLLVMGRKNIQLDGGVKYVAINIFATLLFITALGLTYGMTGTLNMADLHLKLAHVDPVGMRTAVAMLFVAAFGIKAGIFPLYFWLPAAYHTLPPAVAALFAGLLTKVGVYALMRLTTLVFAVDSAFICRVLLVLALLTMTSGVLGAAAHKDIRRILSFHIISQVGYMVLGLALFTPMALAGAVFYLIHHIIVKASLFLVGGMIWHSGASFDLDHLGGLYHRRPLVAFLFFIPAFSLAGFPPLSGFWAKMILIRAGIEVGAVTAVTVAIVVGLLTAYSMTKIWDKAFWKLAPNQAEKQDLPLNGPSAWMLAPVAVLVLLTVAIGFGVEPVYRLALKSAESMLQPDLYIQAVLGKGVP